MTPLNDDISGTGRRVNTRKLLAQPSELVRYALGHWLMIVIAWLGMAIVDSWMTAVLGVVFIAGQFHALGVLLHDACHMDTPTHCFRLRLLEVLAGWSLGSTIEAMRYHHLRHHRAQDRRSDPYWHPLQQRGRCGLALVTLRGALLPLWWSARAFFAVWAGWFPQARRVYARAFLQHQGLLTEDDDAQIILCVRADFGQCAAHLVGALVILIAGFPFVIYYLAPWILAGLINARRVAVEHAATGISHASREQIWSSTVTQANHWLDRWLLAPHNIGFHQAHHVYPQLSFKHLPQVHGVLLERMKGRAHAELIQDSKG